VTEAQGWRENPLAPVPGTCIGSLDDIPEEGVKELVFGTGRRVFSMLLVRCGSGVRAYVNACPHVWLPLTFRSPRVLSADRERLVCSNHHAEFSVEDGAALSGPVTPGCRLASIPVQVGADGELIIGGAAGCQAEA
jgi:nitrite reductase/ring-hydroxylating ferredoxin subunit